MRGRNLTFRVVLRRGRCSQLYCALFFSPISVISLEVAREVGPHAFLRPGPAARTPTSVPFPPVGRGTFAEMLEEARNWLFPQVGNIAAH